MEYTVKIRLESPIITQFQSDTLFGHICWAIRYLWGAERLTVFLSKYKVKPPPLLISNGFPEGFLPKPILPPVRQADSQPILSDDRILDSHTIKSIKKANLVPISVFKALQDSKISPQGLFAAMYRDYNAIMDVEKKRVNASVRHNTVNRIKNRVEEGLFDQNEFFCREDFNLFSVYVRTSLFSEDNLQEVFEFMGDNGFGKDKNTGKGHFKVEKVGVGIDLPTWENPNAFMTLSSYIPAEGEETTRAYYRVLQKHGKLGGMYAQGNPFKKPLLMLKAGSVFYDNPLKSSYGSLIEEVHHTHKHVRHYAYAFPMGVEIEGV